jgi:hypothetical protein
MALGIIHSQPHQVLAIGKLLDGALERVLGIAVQIAFHIPREAIS